MAWVHLPSVGSPLVAGYGLSFEAAKELRDAMDERAKAVLGLTAYVRIPGANDEERRIPQVNWELYNPVTGLTHSATPFELMRDRLCFYFAYPPSITTPPIGAGIIQFDFNSLYSFAEYVAGSEAQWDAINDAWKAHGPNFLLSIQVMRQAIVSMEYVCVQAHAAGCAIVVRRYDTPYPGTEALTFTDTGNFIGIGGVSGAYVVANRELDGNRIEVDYTFENTSIFLSPGLIAYVWMSVQTFAGSGGYTGTDSLGVDIDGAGTQSIAFPQVPSPPPYASATQYTVAQASASGVTFTNRAEVSSYGTPTGPEFLDGQVGAAYNGVAFKPAWTYP